MSFYAVIMAGGVGKRFWPQSRKKHPKQLLNITDEQSMLRLTVERLKHLTDIGRILIVTNSEQEEGIREEIPELPEENIIIEPAGKNTAPAIGLAAVYVHNRDKNAVMGVFPADHLVGDTEKFVNYLHEGIAVAQETYGLITFGVVPTRPATGYGYIQFSDANHQVKSAFPVKTFAEKPNPETARAFLKSGDFLWNSGMFVWTTPAILDAIEKYIPELYDSLKNIREAMGNKAFESVLTIEWATLRSESVDYGIMEKADNVWVVKVDYPWNDVGSWDAVYEISRKDDNGNVVQGDVLMRDSSNNLVLTGNRAVSLVGIDGLIVIDTPDALMIVRRGDSEDVKHVVDELDRQNREELL
ncbi:MAG: NTP transferase domain-containing protein [Candidatus Marinimicrobia bacterium]|nr:NTP transferase domain-containing protein [Candidatus Neomarinimicrobiota bacterium]MCF7839427.1 NTP transferase domain-containing protein [Candidatus Neomarinimicrobiota bacterium]